MINSKKLLYMIDLVKECNKCAMLHFYNLCIDNVEYKNSATEIHFKIHYFDVITVATCIYII